MHYAVKNNKMNLLPILLQHPSIDMAAMKDKVTLCIGITCNYHVKVLKSNSLRSFVCLNSNSLWRQEFVCSRCTLY